MTTKISKHPFSFLDVPNPLPTPSTTATSETSERASFRRPTSLDVPLIKGNQERRYSLESPITQASHQTPSPKNLEMETSDSESGCASTASEDTFEAPSIKFDADQFKLWLEMYNRSVRVHDQARKEILLLKEALRQSWKRELDLQSELSKKNNAINVLQEDSQKEKKMCNLFSLKKIR